MPAKKFIPKTEPNKRNVKIVEDLKKLIETKKTILITSIKNLPAFQFQEISKKLRGKAIIKVPKKNLILKALDSSSKEAIKKLKDEIGDSIALLFSDLDAFELAGELLENKSPAKAKAGQEAIENIEIPAGPTELVPGPAISELGALGIQIQIEKGKITIKEPKIIAEKGKKISASAAEIMGKLDIKPFSIGFIPLCAFDNEEGKFYAELKIDKEGTLKSLKDSYKRALPFAVEIGYTNKETIKFLIGKAGRYGKILENLEPVKEKPAEKKGSGEADNEKLIDVNTNNKKDLVEGENVGEEIPINQTPEENKGEENN